MKRYFLAFSLIGIILLSLSSAAFSGNDCTEWLGTWAYKHYFEDGSGGSTNDYWLVTNADKYAATGIWYPETNPSYTKNLRIVWSSSEGLYLAYNSHNINDDPMKVVKIGDTFSGWVKSKYFGTVRMEGWRYTPPETTTTTTTTTTSTTTTSTSTTTTTTLPTVPTEPNLSVTIVGPNVTLSWGAINNATGYTLYYAPYPEANPIGNIPMGHNTSMSASLPDGSAFYVALQAYNSFGKSGYSNIEHFIIDTAGTYTNSLGMTFVLLPAGTFTMGSPADEPGRITVERQHEVTLTKAFYIQTTEVTQAQWEAVMGSNPSSFSECATCPVEQVSWNDVQSFITQMNIRDEGTYSLPTEAQWEYAARAGSTTAFANGGITEYSDMSECEYDSNLDAIGWYCYNSGNETHPVGQKSPNAWGLYDMHGNVWEWCQNWHYNYSSSAVTDPTGPSSGAYRSYRGGGLYDDARWCRSAIRSYTYPDTLYYYLGFRLLWQP